MQYRDNSIGFCDLKEDTTFYSTAYCTPGKFYIKKDGGGCCGKELNAFDVEANEWKFFNCFAHCERCLELKANPSHKEFLLSLDVPPWTVEFIEDMPKERETGALLPRHEDRFVEYEPSDTWALFFDLVYKEIAPNIEVIDEFGV